MLRERRVIRLAISVHIIYLFQRFESFTQYQMITQLKVRVIFADLY